MSVPQDFWCTTELVLQILISLPPGDLRNCAQVSRSFNRTAVQSVLDQYGIWNAQQSAYFQLVDNPNDLDALSALLLSVHVKSLSYAAFDLKKVTSLQSALKAFHKMQRLVDRMASLRSVYVNWPSEAYLDQPINDKMLAAAYKDVEIFLDTIVAKGCTTLQFGELNAFASKYRLKKNPAFASAEVPSTPVDEISSVWGRARRHLSSQHTRWVSGASDPLSEESNYCRKPGRFSISTPTWISLTPSPKLSQVTKLASFCAFSPSILRPPFSQWTFALLKASPVTFITVSFQGVTDNVELKLILDRLAEAAPHATTIVIEGVRADFMKVAGPWLGCFQKLKDLRIEPKRPRGITDNFDDLGLHTLARLPRLRTLTSSSPLLCSYLASCRSVDATSINSIGLIMGYMWTSSTRSAVSAFIKDVERFHDAIMEALPYPDVQRPEIRIKLRFDDFFYRAKQLERRWNHRNQLRGDDGNTSQFQQCFSPSNSRASYQLCLELHLSATANEIQQGDVDKELIAFCRIFPGLNKLWLRSPEPQVVAFDRRRPLAQERLNQLRTVCPDLTYGSVCRKKLA